MSLSASYHHNYGQCGICIKGHDSSNFLILPWEQHFLLTSQANNAIHVLKKWRKKYNTFHCFIFKTVIKERNNLQFVFCTTWLEPQKVQISNAVIARQTRPAVGMQIRPSTEISKNYYRHGLLALRKSWKIK